MNNFYNKLKKQARALSLVLFALCAFSYASMAQISVTATAGTVGPTAYASIAAAFTAINAGTHQGAITISITASETEPVTPGFLNASGAGSASYTSVLIRPVIDGVVVQGAPTATNKPVFWFNGADNVTIDGDNPNTAGTNRNLTIKNTVASATAGTSVITFRSAPAPGNGSDNNTVKNCIITGNANATYTTTTFGIFAGLAASSSATAPVAVANGLTAGPGTFKIGRAHV